MAKYNNQKAKVLFLQQMMYETGENHTISMQEIIDRLQDKGIRAERKSIYDDMEALRFFGMDIQYKRERPSGYYLANGAEMIKGGFSAPAQNMVKAGKDIGTADGEASSAAEQIPEKEPAVLQTQDAPIPAKEEKPAVKDRSWMQSGTSGDTGKQMKLSCTDEGKEAVREFFDDSVSFKFRDGAYVAAVPLRDDKVFFGWITAMGDDVQILKPKKVSQAYRDYIKQLSRKYKADK